MHAYLRHVGYGYVARFSYNLYGETGFKSWLIKTGEGCTSKSGFKLSRCHNSIESEINDKMWEGLIGFQMKHELPVILPDFPTTSAVAAFVEPMEAVRQVGSKPQLNFILPAFGQHCVREQGKLVEARIFQNLEGPHAFWCEEQHIGYLHLLGMENDAAGVFVHVQLNTDDASEVKGCQVGMDAQVIVKGGHSFRESHVVPREWLTTGGYGNFLMLIW